MRRGLVVLLVLLSAGARAEEPDASKTLTLECTTSRPRLTLAQCVERSLANDARVEEAEAKVKGHEATLAEVEAVYYPKLKGMAWVAPMFTVTGSALQHDVKRSYGWSDWGPYTHLKAQLAQPLCTFGRYDAGKSAATHRVLVEKARVREAQHAVALEVVRMYMTHLMARGIQPALDSAAKLLADAQQTGREEYEKGSGKVTQIDLMRLRYGALEIEKHRLAARDGAELSLAALKRLVGADPDDGLELADARLPEAQSEALPPLDDLVAEATRSRPEWTQIEHGEQAARQLEKAEKLANAPVLFVGGEIEHDWAPTRTDSPNPFHYDPYNDFVGGVAVGLLFDLDPALSVAKADKARALQARVSALKRLADSGIPLQVRKARADVERLAQVVRLSTEAEVAAKKWMTSGAAGYVAGVGEARDLLEGLAAWLFARRDHLQGLLDYHVALGELTQAVGRVPGRDPLPEATVTP
jgi:outer membrane protein TolC